MMIFSLLRKLSLLVKPVTKFCRCIQISPVFRIARLIVFGKRPEADIDQQNPYNPVKHNIVEHQTQYDTGQRGKFQKF